VVCVVCSVLCVARVGNMSRMVCERCTAYCVVCVGPGVMFRELCLLCMLNVMCCVL